jgi:hypothetical protein
MPVGYDGTLDLIGTIDNDWVNLDGMDLSTPTSKLKIDNHSIKLDELNLTVSKEGQYQESVSSCVMKIRLLMSTSSPFTVGEDLFL